MIAAIDWTYIIVALISGLPAIIAAIFAGRVNRKIRTPSGTPIGDQVENVLHTSLANHYRIRKIGGAVGADTSPAAGTEAAKVPDLPEGDGEPLP
jgi:hypothetical protein